MKATLLALSAAVLAVTAACSKSDNDEAARQAETFRANEVPGSTAPSHGANGAAHGANGAAMDKNGNHHADTNRVGLDVGVDKAGNSYKLNADGYRVDERGQRIDSNTDTLGADVKVGAHSAGDKIDAATGNVVATGHGVDNGAKHDGVGDLDLGRTLNEKGDVADRTQQFKVGDPIVASIDADNLAAKGALTATLRTKEGKVITTAKSTMSAGKENASFQLGKAPAAGDYVLTVSGSGGEIESQAFSIR